MTSTVNQIIIGDNKLDFGTPITKTTTSGFKVFDLSTVLGSTFYIGTTGTSPNWTNVGTTHTLNIPFANASGVTSGLLSNTEYLSFKNGRWTTLGNSGTVQATNFLGTIDNVGLSFRTNNVIRQTIDNSGKVGIGTTTPVSLLDVAGSLSLVPLVTTATAYTLTDLNNVIYLTSTLSQTITLPLYSSVVGRIYTIINPTATNKLFSTTVTTIEGPPLVTIPPFKSLTIQALSTEWRIIWENTIDATTALSGRINTGTQTFSGNKTFNGNTTLGDATTDIHNINGTLNINNAITNTPLVLGNFLAGGTIATAATLASYSYVTISQTTANVSLLLPTMGAGDVNKLLYVENKGSVAVILDLINYILPNKGILFRWNATGWVSYEDNSRTPLIATATSSILLGYKDVICQNGATNITLTLPDPSICVGQKVSFTRDPGSTGTVTITNSGTARIQALNGTVGATTSIAAFGANKTWNAGFIATNTSLGYAWLRFS